MSLWEPANYFFLSTEVIFNTNLFRTMLLFQNHSFPPSRLINRFLDWWMVWLFLNLVRSLSDLFPIKLSIRQFMLRTCQAESFPLPIHHFSFRYWLIICIKTESLILPAVSSKSIGISLEGIVLEPSKKLFSNFTLL